MKPLIEILPEVCRDAREMLLADNVPALFCDFYMGVFCERNDDCRVGPLRCQPYGDACGLPAGGGLRVPAAPGPVYGIVSDFVPAYGPGLVVEYAALGRPGRVEGLEDA